jgi:hypothetical protein
VDSVPFVAHLELKMNLLTLWTDASLAFPVLFYVLALFLWPTYKSIELDFISQIMFYFSKTKQTTKNKRNFDENINYNRTVQAF